MRLLVVEDNAQLSQLLAKGLQTVGYQTDQLATAADARAALLTRSYAALVDSMIASRACAAEPMIIS